jgi:hypothetical protein
VDKRTFLPSTFSARAREKKTIPKEDLTRICSQKVLNPLFY